MVATRSVSEALVHFDTLVGHDQRYTVMPYWPGFGRCNIYVDLMLPPHRKYAFSSGQSFDQVGIYDRPHKTWFLIEDLMADAAQRREDHYGEYLHYSFHGSGEVWSGADPNKLELWSPWLSSTRGFEIVTQDSPEA